MFWVLGSWVNQSKSLGAAALPPLHLVESGRGCGKVASLEVCIREAREKHWVAGLVHADVSEEGEGDVELAVGERVVVPGLAWTEDRRL